MPRRKEQDDLKVLRALYSYLREHPSRTVRSWAWLTWERLHGETPTTFIVNSAGEALPFNRAALIAEYRLQLLDLGLPVGFLSAFDRTDN